MKAKVIIMLAFMLVSLAAPMNVAIAAVGTNPGTGNPNDYGGAGDWLGTADDDQYTNSNGATVSGDVDMTQGGADNLTNDGVVTGDVTLSSDGGGEIDNSGAVGGDIRGSQNSSSGDAGGQNSITNSGAVGGDIFGSYNSTGGASGGENTILNSGSACGFIYGSNNVGDDSEGGYNEVHINVGGTVGVDVYGSNNVGADSTGGINYITNLGTVDNDLYGSNNVGAGSSGGGNMIEIGEDGAVAGDVYGTCNQGANSSGGENQIFNTGTITGSVAGSSNEASGTSGGENSVVNRGVIHGSVAGSNNEANGTSGSGNGALNDGTIDGRLVGSNNQGAGASGGQNVLYNLGTVGQDIVASRNSGAGASGGQNFIINYGQADSFVAGSHNIGANSEGGTNVIYNTGDVAGSILGSYNQGDGSEGGGNSILNVGSASAIEGSANAGAGSSGGENLVLNAGTTYNAQGSWNTGVNSSGGGNTLYNHGSITYNLCGSANVGAGSSGGENQIYNTSAVGDSILGSYNQGANASGGENSIENTGQADYIDGSWNIGDGSSGGENTIYNYAGGLVLTDIYGSANDGVGSSGGDNQIYNYGTVSGSIHGSFNYGANTSGGDNYIANYGTVLGSVYGGVNAGMDTSGGGNHIYNYGTVQGSIRGSDDRGGNATSTGNVIFNYGVVGESIWSGDGDDVIHLLGGSVGGWVLAGDGDDTVIYSGGSSVGSGVSGQSGVDSLSLVGSGVFDADKFFDFERISYDGTGNATFINDWEFTSSLYIRGRLTLPDDQTIGAPTFTLSGSAFINGTLDSRLVTINPGGFLGGVGAILGNVVNHGWFSPGNSIGTMTVIGDYHNASDGVLLIELDPSGACDLVRILNNGVAYLDGYAQVSLPQALYTNGQSWTIISAGAVQGSFLGLQGLPTSQTVSLTPVYHADSVSLDIARVSFASLALTPGQKGVGAALDAIVPLAQARQDQMTQLLLAMDWSYDLSQIRQTLEAANPEMYDAFSAASLSGARTFDRMLWWRSLTARSAANQAAGASGPTQAASQELSANGQAGGGWSAWARALGDWSNQSGDSGHLGYRLGSGGAIVGVDGRVLPWLSTGLAMASSVTNIDWSMAGHEGDQRALNIGLYASADLEAFYLNAAFSYGAYDNSAKRQSWLDGQGVKANADFDGQTWLARLGGGHDWLLAGWRVGPTASLEYVNLREDAFDESGAGLMSLRVKDRSENYLGSRLGARAAYDWACGAATLSPGGYVNWLHNFDADARTVQATFRDYGSAPISVEGLEPAADMLEAGLGLSAAFGPTFSLFVEGTILQSSSWSAQAVTAGLNVAF